MMLSRTEDYLEQLMFLLFLKMADEQSHPPFNKKSPIPEKYSCSERVNHDGVWSWSAR